MPFPGIPAKGPLPTYVGRGGASPFLDAHVAVPSITRNVLTSQTSRSVPSCTQLHRSATMEIDLSA